MKNYIIVLFIFLGVYIFGTTCFPDPHHAEHKAHLMEVLKEHQSMIDYAHQNDFLDTTFLQKVHAEVPEVSDFFTEKRKTGLTSFPCANCHNQSMATLQVNQKPDTKKAHWGIELVHANAAAMNCETCHSYQSMNQLKSLTGQMIDLDESFKLCGQCHSTQYKDWQGGAHGKQLNGWKPPRVATTCVSCHNPHQPAFPKRFPARLNTYETEK